VSHVIVMAKEPVAGKVKTRLCPPCSGSSAAAVAAAALADTLDAVAACGASRRVVALAGSPGDWLPPGFEIVRQRGDGLASRLANAWSDVGGPGIQIGMDTPQVTGTELDSLLSIVDKPAAVGSAAVGPAVLGPARDGGWWVIGWHRADPHAVFTGIPMSEPTTGALQERRLRELGLDVVRAPLRRDIDTIDDLAAVALATPGSRTAEVAARVLGLGSPAALR